LNPNVPTDIIYKNIIEILKENKLTIEDIETFHIDSPGQFLVDFRDKFGINNAMLPNKNDRDTSIKDFDLGFRKNEIVVSDKCYWLNQTLARGMWDSKRKNFANVDSNLGHLDMLMCGVYAYRMRDENWRPSSHERDVFFMDKRGNEFIDMEVVYAKQERKQELKKLAKAFGGKIK
jgi:hypothetical protein